MRSELLVQVAFSFQLYLSLLFKKSFHGVSRLSIGILEGQLPYVLASFYLNNIFRLQSSYGKISLIFFLLFFIL